MKLLITGAGGFLGHHLKQEFIHQNIDILTPRSYEVNLFDLARINSYLSYHKPDKIVHLAARCAGIGGNAENPGLFLYTNTQMALNIYEAARLSNIKYVYGIGTVCMYPKYCPTPFKEEYILGAFDKNFQTEGNYPEETNAPYSYAKRILMLLGQTYRQQYGIKGAFLIPGNMFGENDTFNTTSSHVIPSLIMKFDNAKLHNLPTVECWGTGVATREFLYAPNAADAIVKAITSNLDTDLPINLGTGKDISIANLANLIKELVGYTGEITFNGQLDGQPKRLLDVSRAKSILGWEATTSLRDGLKKTIDWYNAHRLA